MTHAIDFVPETYETITRPVVYNVIDQMAILSTIARDIRVLFPGGVEVSYQVGSTVDQNQPDNTFLSEGQLTVKVEENFVEDRVMNTAISRRENEAVFRDSLLGVCIRPIYAFTELVMTFTYRAPNATLARRLRDDLKIQRSQGRLENLHEINYSYGVPLNFFPILQEIHTLRENVAGYGDTYEQWFGNHVTAKATVAVNMAGREPSIIVREMQNRVLGWYDFTVTVDEPQRGEGAETGAYEIGFTYRVQFDKPTAAILNYPIVVHNQLIPAPYLVNNWNYALRDRMSTPSWSRRLFDRFTMIMSDDNLGVDGVRTPVYDDWRPRDVFPDTSSLINMMLQVDATNPFDVIRLDQLPGYAIDPDILAFIQSEGTAVLRYNESPINLCLYENDRMLGDTGLTIDAGSNYLHLYSSFAMDPRKTYHLRISMVNDLLGMPQGTQDRMRRSGVACIKMLATLEANLPGGVVIPTLVGGQLVSREDFEAAAYRINARKRPLKGKTEYILLATIGNFLIATGRE